ncbi:probable low affinity copper uptake protein 2 [Thalassophryne amazonica]|uniref:probable low affinity copper uptake protein 2 n=1 Tax=Thalassophryne amazonica TaxID=390379 RepID=UPI0014722F8C|nr:probable low affinity copper uptake protein 2 [Thalassophryne amazonica]
MMSMTFYVSSSVQLLFDFWDVNNPAGMVLSVFVVLLLSFFYELLKVFRQSMNLPQMAPLRTPYKVPPSCSSPEMHGTTSESSLAPIETGLTTADPKNSWLTHFVQTILHMLQVILGYLLMLCVMSYNTWIFLAVIAGSVLGYFILFPLLERMQQRGYV